MKLTVLTTREKQAHRLLSNSCSWQKTDYSSLFSSESYAKLLHISEFQREKKWLLEENPLKEWNIQENKARIKTHKAGPAVPRHWVPPHTVHRISHLMVLATWHGWKLPVGSSMFEFWKELGISDISILKKSRGKNYWPRASSVLITTVHICTRKFGIWCLFKLRLYNGFWFILHL